MNNLNVTMNAEKNGVELRFDGKPDRHILDILKQNGFRWSNYHKMWYAKQTERTMEIVNMLSENDTISIDTENKAESCEYDLWALTRIDSIGNNVDKSLDTKAIASAIRKHIRPRFPMCRFSVTSDYDSIRIEIKSSPFSKNSDMLNAVREYVEAYAKSFRYCTSYDPYGDYGSSYSFYLSGCSLAWDYEALEVTVSMLNICENFQQKKKAYEEAEYERQQREYKEQMEKQRIESEKAEALRKEAEAKRDYIQKTVSEKSVNYFVEDLIDCHISKLDSEDEYSSYDGETSFYTCKVTKEIHMDHEQYEFFKNAFLMDWDFVAGTGGSETDDLRIGSMTDFNMMSKAERATVEWYSTDCVAVFCDGEMKLVVDAQGFDYCRYVYFVCDDTRVYDEHETEQTISEQQHEEDINSANHIVDISEKVIADNNLSDTWDTDGFEKYKEALKEYIYAHNVRFDAGVIRAISPYDERIKVAMYKVLKDMRSVQEQFRRSGFQPGQKITIVKLGEFGGVNIIRATFDSFQETKYAQYDDAVKLTVTPERKHNKYYMYIYGDVMIFDGWQPDIPESLLWEIEESNGGIITKRGRFSSFDEEQYNVVFEYYKNLGAPLVIDTRSNGVYK